MHPQFAANRFVYLYYVKSDADARTTLGLARARLEGTELADVREVFEADAWIQGGPIAGRAVFGPDGMIYMTINDHDKNNAIDDPSVRIFAQHLDSDVGKVLRVRDDGGIPADNPFVGREDAQPSGVHVRPSQHDGLRVASDDGRAVGHGDRADGRRRDQHPARRPELRLAARFARQALHEGPSLGAALVSRGHGDALHVLDAVDQPELARVVHRRQARAVARQPVRRRA